jgi:hypothetical protein
MSLTDLIIKNKKPTDKPYKLPDDRGLFLLVHPNGSKYWRFRYSFGGKERLLALGVYPEISLAEARDKREEARRLIANGVDPGIMKQTSKRAARIAQGNSFEAVAREWYAKHSPRWAPSHSETIISRLERDIFPWIGNHPIAEITPPQLLQVLRRIEDRGALDTAHRDLQNCGRIFRYAVATGRAERDPTSDLRGALPPTRATHYASITEPNKVGELLRAIEGYEGSFITKCAFCAWLHWHSRVLASYGRQNGQRLI